MRSQEEVLIKIRELEKHRKNVLKNRGGGEYSKKIYHYIRVLRWTLEVLDDDDLGVHSGFEL